jgi:peptidoglycan/LPS O-acetylase OafA/YrhL
MTAAKDRPAEIRGLTGARALPPLLLVLYHYHEGHGYQHWRVFDVFVAKSYLWVEFFFALSAFVLVHVYGPRMRALWTARGYGDFLKARLARLYPVHLAMLLILLAMMIALRALAAWGGYVSVFDLAAYHPHTGVTSFVANLFLVQAWHLFPYLTWNGVAWFVSVEVFLCLVFPVYAWLAGGGAWRAMAMILAGFAALYGLARTSGHGLDITYDWGVFRGLADFAIGAGMAMLYRHAKARGADAMPAPVISVVQLLVAGAFLYAIYNTGWSHRPADFWVVPPMMMLILAVAFDRGALAWLLGTAPLRRLGHWSYAIYMGQTTWLMLLRFAEQRLYPGAADAHWVHIVEPAGLVIACTLWGWLLYAAVERPANAFLRGRFARARMRDTAAA